MSAETPNPVIKHYDLSGGDEVTVIKPFGNDIYAAVATLKGNDYPEKGKIAQNAGRTEFMYMLDGQMEITINGETQTVKAGELVQVNDGDTYSIVGEGRSLVIVRDEEGGETKMLTKE